MELDLGSAQGAEAAKVVDQLGGWDSTKAEQYRALLAKHRQDQRVHGDTPMEFAIDRDFLAAQLEALGQPIANAVVERDPASLALTFRGKPVDELAERRGGIASPDDGSTARLPQNYGGYPGVLCGEACRQRGSL